MLCKFQSLAFTFWPGYIGTLIIDTQADLHRRIEARTVRNRLLPVMVYLISML